MSISQNLYCIKTTRLDIAMRRRQTQTTTKWMLWHFEIVYDHEDSRSHYSLSCLSSAKFLHFVYLSFLCYTSGCRCIMHDVKDYENQWKTLIVQFYFPSVTTTMLHNFFDSWNFSIQHVLLNMGAYIAIKWVFCCCWRLWQAVVNWHFHYDTDKTNLSRLNQFEQGAQKLDHIHTCRMLFGWVYKMLQNIYIIKPPQYLKCSNFEMFIAKVICALPLRQIKKKY